MKDEGETYLNRYLQNTFHDYVSAQIEEQIQNAVDDDDVKRLESKRNHQLRSLCDLAGRTAIIKGLRCDLRDENKMNINSSRLFVVFREGIFDLITQKLRPLAANEYVSNAQMMGVPYKSREDSADDIRMFAENLAKQLPDADVRDELQVQSVFATLTLTTKHGCILWGPLGNNGKSSFLEI